MKVARHEVIKRDEAIDVGVSEWIKV